MLRPGALASVVVVEPVRALLRHKLRTALSTLGIAIGVVALVLMVAVGEAGSRRAQAELEKLGDNLVWIEAGSRNVAGVRTGTHGTTSLTLEDEEAVEREVPRLKACSPQIDGSLQAIRGGRNWMTRWRGESPDYLAIRRWIVAEGAPFSADDVTRSASKVLLGETVRQQLFGALPAVGEVVRLSGQLFEVAGVLAPKGQSPDGRDQDDWILLPHTTAQARLRGRGPRYLDDIFCSARAADQVNAAIDEVIALMRQRHHIGPADEDDFNIRRPDEVLKAQRDASDAMARFLVAIAAISLLVGGIGIMNVMLAAVLQRTREIGLRLSVGATGALVLLQFLGEAVLLALAGATLGIAVSALGASAFGSLLEWEIAISARAVGVAVASSVCVGLVSGLQPAWRAARLDPIEALRHE